MVGLSSKISWGSGRCTVMMLFSVVPAFSKLLHYIEPPGQSQYVKQSNSDTCFVRMCTNLRWGTLNSEEQRQAANRIPTTHPRSAQIAFCNPVVAQKVVAKNISKIVQWDQKIARGGGFDLLRQDV
jgi:hypothetical protein